VAKPFGKPDDAKEVVIMAKQSQDQSQQQNQGEGNREAAREYNKDTREFIESGKVDEAAKRAKDQDPEEAREAEKAGLEKAREKDPAETRDYDKPSK
jgi:hypothetical protein